MTVTISTPAALGRVALKDWHDAAHLEHIQRAVMRAALNPNGRLIVSIPPRHGKALALDTPIPTPTGWSTMGELRVGDEVFDEQGRPTRVVAVSEVWRDRPVWRVRTDDGDEIVADAEHLWRVDLDRKRGVFSIHTTEFIGRPRQKRALVERQGALDLPDADLPIDPYVLGVWLGDGTSANAAVTQGLEDGPFVFGQIAAAGYELRPRSKPTHMGVGSGLQVALRELGLLNNKHIPQQYLRASRAQRLALLQGLVDTDGGVRLDGQVEVSGINEALLLGVHELVCSLGRKAALIRGEARLNGRYISPLYRVMFYMAGCARLPRKAERTRDVVKTPHRYISAERAGTADTVCIQVEAVSGMFLAGRSMLPTHNSTLISRLTPAWYLSVKPDHRVMLASYEADFASSWGRSVRDLIEQVPALGITVRADSSAANRWDIAGHDGGMVTAGVGGAITGRGAHVLLVDDPVKNAESAQSKVLRERAWEWWTSTAYTRLEPGGSAILVMTRWHDDDLAGRLLQEGGWDEIRLPAIADEDDPLGREPGAALWPQRYDLTTLEDIRRNLGSYWWSALYQQRPQPATGGMFRREWFRRWRHDGPDAFVLESPSGPRRVAWKDTWRFGTMDVAASTRDTADYTVLSCWAVTPEKDLVLLDCYRVRMEGPDQPALIARAVAEQALGFVAVERVAYQLTLLQTARRQGLPVRELKADRDKVSRALAAAARYESGQVYHPASAVWLADWEEELLGFPTAAHDDQVDTVAYAATELARGSFDGIAHADSALVWG